MYLSSDFDFWDWKTDIDIFGKWEGGSDYYNFYDKIDELLSKVTYYCASAMQWVYEEARKKLDEKGINDINPNYYAEHPVNPPDKKIGTEPKSNPKSKDDAQMSLDKFTKDTAKNAAKNAPKLLTGGGVGVIGYKIIKNLKKSNKKAVSGLKKKR